MRNKIVLMYLTLVVLLIPCLYGLNKDFAGGSGTQDDPYLLETGVHLSNIRNSLDAHFRQTADISLLAFVRAEGWHPIGYWEEAPFTGSFDGNGYTISDLYINRPENEDVGLFGYIFGAHLDNIILEDVWVSGEHNTGGVVGYSSNSTISNVTGGGIVSGFHDTGLLVGKMTDSNMNGCHVSGWVSGSLRTGGLTGRIDSNSSIIDSYSGAHVYAGVETGGLVGLNKGDIFSTFATGDITSGDSGIGGLVGRNQGTIQDSYAKGAVNGLSEGVGIGGLVGRNDADANITRCFSVGAVSGASDKGGLVGSNSGRINASHYDYETSGMKDTGKGTPRSTANMKTQETFKGWEFNGTWGIIENITYPFLRWEGLFAVFYADKTVTEPGKGVQFTGYVSENIDMWIWDFGDGNTSTELNPTHAYILPGSYTVSFYVSNVDGDYIKTRENYITVGFAGGSGMENDPYLVATPSHLYNVRYDLEGNYQQVADIDLSGYSENEGWPLFGTLGHVNDRFYGKYNGGGHTISNLFIRRPNKYYSGLFGFAEEAHFANIHMENVQIEGHQFTGGLVGWASNSVIENCTVSGSISGSTAGMLVGNMSFGGSVESCSAKGVIEGNGNTVGGLVGSSSGKIMDSHASVRVTGDERVGGLVGFSQSEISDCYAYGDVTGNNYVGGLVGRNRNNITASHAFGKVTGQGYVGGLVGIIYVQSNLVKESFATGSVFGNKYVGGLVGDNRGEIIDCYATGQITGIGSSSGDIGGLVGYNRQNGQIKNSYSAGTSTGYEFVGGLVGWCNGTVEKSFYDKEVSGHSDTGKGEPKTTSEMMEFSTYSGWNFAGVWAITAGSCYPYFFRFRTDEEYHAMIEGFDFPCLMHNNTTYEVTLTLRNTGNSSWLAVDQILLGAVGNHDYLVPSTSWRCDLDHPVFGGGLHTFHFTAEPENTGVFTTQWQMLKEGEFWFGEILSRDVEVRQRTGVERDIWQLMK